MLHSPLDALESRCRPIATVNRNKSAPFCAAEVKEEKADPISSTQSGCEKGPDRRFRGRG